jgi:FlaG/FlaF family flagellin (archaellin)
MKIRKLITDEQAVSSAIGVVLMVAVAVVLAAAVGAFAIDLATESTTKVPTASIETKWSERTSGGDSFDRVEITIEGGNALEAEYVTVSVGGDLAWDGSPQGNTQTFGGQKWSSGKIQSGDTLGLEETSTSDWATDETLRVVWNNGDKSQVLGTGTVQ